MGYINRKPNKKELIPLKGSRKFWHKKWQQKLQQTTQNLIQKKPIPTPLKSVPKKNKVIFSKLLFLPAYKKYRKINKNREKDELFLSKKFMWIFTFKNMFRWTKKWKDSKNNNFGYWMRYKKFLKICSSDLRNGLSSKKALHKFLGHDIKNYLSNVPLHKTEKQRMEICGLRRLHRARLSPFFFQPWKKIKVVPTGRQHWLNTTYSRYQSLRFKDRIDFFRTYLGQMIAGMALKKTGWYLHQGSRVQRAQYYSKFRNCHKMGWWYENLIQKKPTPRSAKRFILDRPKTAFQIHWTQQKLEPWKNILIFKRALYSGFGEEYRKENKFQTLKMKKYLRSKNPRQEKRNRLYTRANLLLNNFRQRSRIRRDKLKRIKQIASKILRPFYGHLRPHQITKIIKKSKKIKSKTLTGNEVILSHFEKRLDVVVYRINLAPSILWARRLITAGLVFVIPAHSHLLWESMYCGLKKLSFPLKLRDPKKLYSKTYWTYAHENWIEFKFLGQPKRKISYLLQPGELIQCAGGAYLNHFKTQSSLCRKPIPTHLMVQRKKNSLWDWHEQKFKRQAFKVWEESLEPVYTTIFLDAPQYRNLDSKDRVKESFFRWAML